MSRNICFTIHKYLKRCFTFYPDIFLFKRTEKTVGFAFKIHYTPPNLKFYRHTLNIPPYKIIMSVFYMYIL